MKIITQASWKKATNPAEDGIDMIIIPDHDSLELRKSTESALDDISGPVMIPDAVAVSNHVLMVFAMGSQQTGPSFLQPSSSGIAVRRER